MGTLNHNENVYLLSVPKLNYFHTDIDNIFLDDLFKFCIIIFNFIEMSLQYLLFLKTNR